MKRVLVLYTVINLVGAPLILVLFFPVREFWEHATRFLVMLIYFNVLFTLTLAIGDHLGFLVNFQIDRLVIFCLTYIRHRQSPRSL